MDLIGSCISPTLIKNPDRLSADRFITVPCGQCHRCRKRRAAQWTVRLQQEHRAAMPGSSFFYTFTYDSDNVPITSKGKLTLNYSDVQLLWKRYRKKFPIVPLKYYAVGEYGGKIGRPHYHAIVFNCLQPEYLRDQWPNGNVHVDQCNLATMSYVTGYVMKPSSRKEEEKSGEIERTRPYISKGLGARYVTEMSNYHTCNLDNNYVTLPGGRKVAMPRYYQEKMYTNEQLSLLKRRMKKASKEDAARLLAEFSQRHPGWEHERSLNEQRNQEIKYSENFLRQKRNKI